MMTAQLQAILDRAIWLAQVRRQEQASVEHLLLALLDDPDASRALLACQVNLRWLRDELLKHIDKRLADGSPTATAPGPAFQRVVQRAAILAQSEGRSTLGGADVLAALFAERDAHAVHMLQQQGLSREAVLQANVRGERV
ncbi:MAG TPA: Clp protease N-terminal domain-containing protein [Methylomirabilota bacterium]|nr:Clp protease N-terminal domain-containing protein [Methylomirabilota bacterium]